MVVLNGVKPHKVSIKYGFNPNLPTITFDISNLSQF